MNSGKKRVYSQLTHQAGILLKLTPAYDICPQPRTGRTASQAMFIHGNNRMSQLRECINSAPQFQLSAQEAVKIIEGISISIINNWNSVCQESELSEIDRKIFSSNQFFNPFAFENLDADFKYLEKFLKEFRNLPIQSN